MSTDQGTHFKGPVYSGGALLSSAVGTLGMAGYKQFFVDPELGSDANPGSSSRPFATLTKAYDMCVSGRGDIVFLKGGPTSGSTTGHTVRLAATLTWAKNNTHLVGLCAPTRYGQRARITGPSSGGTFSPVMTVSGSGCRFENFAIFDDYTVDPVALKVTGQRNTFVNVNLQGMGAATGADDAAGASLWLAGGAENSFYGCVIGLDTIPRSTTNGEILMDTAAKRNFFEGCYILSYSDNAGHLFVKAANSGDLDRETVFTNCVFLNAPTGIASGTTMTQAMDVHASAGGMIIVNNCLMYGATDWNAGDRSNVIANQLYNGTNMTTQGGIGIAAVR